MSEQKQQTVGVLITARLKSKRLPRKILLDIVGKPALFHMLERIKKAKLIDKVILCTSTNSQDNPLEELAEKEGILCYRGSEDDVLARLYDAATAHKIDFFVNVCADCVLIDPYFVDEIVRSYHKTNADFITANKLPIGQGPCGIKVQALKKVCAIKAETETEVWGDYFIKSKHFQTHDLDIPDSFFHPKLKTSLDYVEDYEFIKAIFANLQKDGQHFSLADIIDFVNRNPHILQINSHCVSMGREHIVRTATPFKLKKQVVK